MPRLAAIGLGNRALGMLKALKTEDPEVDLVALVDPNLPSVRERLKKHEVEVKNVRHFPSAEAMLEHPERYDGVIIGTRCHLHTEMACKVAPTGLPLFLEKPVAITQEQLAQLAAAFAGRMDRVVVSFPLRLTPLFTAVQDIIRSGRLGAINQVQAYNYVTYGGVYFGDWYRNYDEVGGLWLQKATHDFDYINLLMKSAPAMVSATASQVIYRGDMPHDLRCSKCDKTATCPESPRAHERRNDSGGMGGKATEWDHWCAYSRDLRNQDSGAAMILYADGSHAVYSQNFVPRRSSASRGARVTGYDATLEFNWYGETIRVIDHHHERVDQIAVKSTSGHLGGDAALCRYFIDVMRGKCKSPCDLNAGLLSAAMCLAARESSATRTFQPIAIPGASRVQPAPAIGG
jgi:predicted dehydrogenase